eukprot:442946_1
MFILNDESALIIILTPCVLIVFIVIIAFLYKWIIKTVAKRINRFYLCTTLAVMCLYLSATLIDISHASLSYYSGIKMKDPHWNYIKFVADFLYFAGSTVLYINIVGRLYLTFKSTVYRLKIPVLLCIMCLITLSIYVMLMYCYIIIALNNDYLSWSATCDILLMTLDILLNIIILILFIVKLRQLIINVTINNLTIEAQSTSVESTLDDSQTSRLLLANQKLDKFAIERRERLIRIVTRHTILSCIAIICNQCFYSVNSVYYICCSNELWTAISYGGRAIEGVIISLVLFLNFNFNIVIYKKCCNRFHMCCYYCFKKYTNIHVKDLENDGIINVHSGVYHSKNGNDV